VVDGEHAARIRPGLHPPVNGAFGTTDIASCHGERNGREATIDHRPTA
jgi:hypothetical protein